MPSETEIRPFRVDMPDDVLADLRRRIAVTRWPTKELVADRSQDQVHLLSAVSLDLAGRSG